MDIELSAPIEVADLVLDQAPESNQKTAARAKALVVSRPGFFAATPKQQRVIAEAFASTNRPVFGAAFDAVWVDGDEIDFSDLVAVKKNLKRVKLYEIKSTKGNASTEFAGHFFSLTTAELLVAQKLGAQYRFAFVNVQTEGILELTLAEVFQRARAIYPTWSISF